MRIKKFWSFISESHLSDKAVTKQFKEYLLIIGERSEDMFLYFGVEEMHGLNLSDCRNHPEGPDNAYIAGFCNQFPQDASKFFLFLNSQRIGGMLRSAAPYEVPLLIMHECMHMSIEVYGANLSDGELEEKAITWAEEQSKTIIEFMKSIGKL